MIVYWSPTLAGTLSEIEYEEPTRLITRVNKEAKQTSHNNLSSYHICPAVRDYFHNIFELKSPIDFEIIRNENGVDWYTDNYDQSFWNDFVQFRNSNLLSFNIMYLMMPEKSTVIEYTPAYFTDNEFVNKTMIVPGSFNPYNWLRPLQCTFAVKNGVDRIKISKGDTYAYVRFLTNDKIKFKRFIPSKELNGVIDRYLLIKSRNANLLPYIPTPLKNLYDMFESSKIRKYIFNEIEKNTLE